MSLRAFRESKGLTQADVAEALGLSGKSYVSLIEGGAPTPIRLALKIQLWSRGEVPAAGLVSEADAALLQAVIDLGRPPAEEAAA